MGGGSEAKPYRELPTPTFYYRALHISKNELTRVKLIATRVSYYRPLQFTKHVLTHIKMVPLSRDRLLATRSVLARSFSHRLLLGRMRLDLR